MFRLARLFCQKRNTYNVPLFSQRSQPKQIVVEFCVYADNKEEFSIKGEYNTKKIYNYEQDFPLKGSYGGNSSMYPVNLRKDRMPNNSIENFMTKTPHNMIKVLKRLTRKSERQIDILKTAAQVIIQNSSLFSASEICDILYCFAKLSYRNEDCIQTLVDVIKNETTTTHRVASSILHSLGILRYRDPELLDVLLKLLLNLPLEVKSSGECLMSLCFLNYPCSAVDSLVKFLSELGDMDYYERTDYINFVWSCVILNQFEHIAATHIPKINSEFNIFQVKAVAEFHPGVIIKLLNIQKAAELFIKNPNVGPIKKFPREFPGMERKETPFLKSVADSLSYIVPQPGYFKTSVGIEAGFYLDIEFNIDSKKAPIPLKNVDSKSTKVGILLQEYRETCSDKTPTGIFAFKIRVLEQLGYKVTVLNYFEYPMYSPLSDKVNYLREKLSPTMYEQAEEESTN